MTDSNNTAAQSSAPNAKPTTIGQLLDKAVSTHLKPSEKYYETSIIPLSEDPAFGDYMLRVKNRRPFERLQDTTHLTPPTHLFHGSNIGMPLLEGFDQNNEHSSVSIIMRQRGRTLQNIMNDSDAAMYGLREEIRRKPQELKRFYKEVAFVGLFSKPRNMASLDISPGNIMRDSDGHLSMIDQMSYEDVKGNIDHFPDFDKARSSMRALTRMLKELPCDYYPEPEFDQFRKIIDTCEKETNRALNKIQTKYNKCIGEGQRDKAVEMAYRSLQPGTHHDKWKGVVRSEDIALDGEKLGFSGVNDVSGVNLSMQDSPDTLRALLDQLKEQHVISGK